MLLKYVAIYLKHISKCKTYLQIRQAVEHLVLIWPISKCENLLLSRFPADVFPEI